MGAHLLVKVFVRPEISRVTGMLTLGTAIAWLRIYFSIGVTDEGSKSSTLKSSHVNFHIKFLAKAAFIFFAIKKLDTAFFKDAR